MAADDCRLGPVHGANRGPDRCRETHLPHEGELRVEHDTGRAAGARCGGGVQAHAPLAPHRDIDPCDQLLEEDERPDVAHACRALGALGDDPVGASANGAVGIVERHHLDDHPAGTPAGQPVARQETAGSDDHCAHRGRQVVGPDDIGVADPNAEAPVDPDPACRINEGPEGGSGWDHDVQHAEGPGPGQGDDQPGTRLAERRHSPEQVLRTGRDGLTGAAHLRAISARQYASLQQSFLTKPPRLEPNELMRPWLPHTRQSTDLT